MTAQLKNIDAETKKSYLAMIDIEEKYDTSYGYVAFSSQYKFTQLGSPKFEPIRVTQEGDGKYFYAVSDSGKRVEQQWQGFTKKDVFVINSNDGSNKQIMTNVRANIYPSYTGKYLLVYDEDKKQYSCYDADSNKTKPVAKDIPYPLYDEENDVPDAPNAYGIVKWMENDKYVLVYDRYDIWKVDPTGKEKSVCLTNGRKDKIQYRYVTVDNDEKFIKVGQDLFYKRFNENSKKSDYHYSKFNNGKYEFWFDVENSGAASNLLKAKNAFQFIVQKETFQKPADLFIYCPADIDFIPDNINEKSITDKLFTKDDYSSGEFFMYWINSPTSTPNNQTTSGVQQNYLNGKPILASLQKAFYTNQKTSTAPKNIQ